MIENWENKQRLISYTGLRFPSGGVSDVDGVHLAGNSIVFIEFKCGRKPVNPTQSTVYKTLADNAQAAGMRSSIMVARYFDRNPGNTVNAAICWVTEIYTHGKWYDISPHGLTLKQTMDKFLSEKGQ